MSYDDSSSCFFLFLWKNMSTDFLDLETFGFPSHLIFAKTDFPHLSFVLLFHELHFYLTLVRPLLHSSTPDVSLKPRVSEASDLQAQQHNGAPYLPLSRTPFPAVTVDQSISTYSGMARR